MKASIQALYSPSQVSRLLGQPLSTVYRWCAKGTLTTVFVAGKRWIPLSALKTHALVWESIQLAKRLNKSAPS